MDILLFGGTRFFGIHLVNQLLEQGHDVTIATRGLTKDSFGERVKRIVADRQSQTDLEKIFLEKEYDCIIDNICYASNDVKRLLDVAKCKRYILTSTMSVYPAECFRPDMKEQDFNPLSYPLKWYERADAPYFEIKRQAEAALFQQYPEIETAVVRFPYVIGEDDYTKRILFYVERAVSRKAMYVDKPEAQMSFIKATEAGAFLAWLACSKETGIFNAASDGTVSVREMLRYVQDKTGKEAVLAADGEPAPYNGTGEYSLNTDKAKADGFTFTDINSFLYDILDYYIAKTCD